MTTSLNGTISVTSSYPANPRTVDVIPDNIVDWVLVVLGAADTGPAVNESN
jgi:hypothetical protein